MVLQENVPLAPLTTFGVGGPARYFVEAHTSTEVAEAVLFSSSRDLPLFVLGGGSNLVVADSGWLGLVLKPAIKGIDRREEGEKTLFTVGAGESWDDFVARAVTANCAGIECLSGIPGSVGGTPVQNVGAYGQEMSQTIESVEVFDRNDGQVRELCNEACGFSYRSSIFNTTERGRFIILRVTYALSIGGEPHIEYADLRRYFEGRASTPMLDEVRKAVREIRARKGMLIVAGDPDSLSAGSFFKNPVVSDEQMHDLQRRAEARNLVIPSYPALAQSHKVSAAWLVEHSGFNRGYSFGRVGISTKHALALVNQGGATADEVLASRDHIQRKVEELWGVPLESEPVFVGL
jgi:UDP-N-acetylmuramate dehydrogenase